MQFPVSIQLKPSRRLRAALVFLHLLALFAVLLQELLSIVLLGPLLGLSLIWTWRNVRAPKLTLREDGRLLWQTSESEREPVAGRILSGTAFSWLVVLRIRLETEGEGGPTTVLVALSDSLKPSEFRRLQVWLRWVVPVSSAVPGA